MPALSRRLLTCALTLAVAPLARAHDTWLAGPPSATPGGTALFSLTSSGAFPKPDHAIERSRVARSLCRTSGQELKLAVGARGPQALRLRARSVPAGVASCGVSLHPRTLELAAADVPHYLEEIGAQDTIGPAWKARSASKWRETYVKHAKTFTRVGAGHDESWREPIGQGLEIVPLSDPTVLRAGAALEVRLLKNGQPLAGLLLRASRQGSPHVFVATASDGRATFTLDADGPWLLAATELRPSAERPAEWESDFATLSLQVGK